MYDSIELPTPADKAKASFWLGGGDVIWLAP